MNSWIKTLKRATNVSGVGGGDDVVNHLPLGEGSGGGVYHPTASLRAYYCFRTRTAARRLEPAA